MFAAMGCGSSASTSDLFNGSNQCAAQSCAGATQAGGSVATGGASGGGVTGAGGIIPFGGSGGMGGFTTSGGSSGFPTGGFPVTTGGFGGLPDGSFGAGGTGGGPATCPSGHYTGSYAGTYSSIVGMNQVGGNVEFSVDPNGTVTGNYSGTNPNNGAKADLVGTLDCSTGVLTMRVENGTYPGLIGGNVRFSGTMPGQYSADNRSFSGTWMISDTSSQSGSGTWTAQ
jgi:hypothetical protein